jgi:hypothetical protein
VFALGLFAAGVVAGCGSGGGVASVSGTVTLDGAPYANAVVSFQPERTEDNLNPGQGSMATTDQNGHYELLYGGTEKKGAIVGKHRVRISTLPGHGTQTQEPTGSTGTPDGIVPPKSGPPAGAKMDYDPIPVEWNEKSQHTFDVPRGGTTSADFHITTVKKR